MIVTVSVQSELLGDVKVSIDVEDRDDAEAQVKRLLDKMTKRVRLAYDIEEPF